MKHLKFSYVGPISGLRKAITDRIAIEEGLAKVYATIPLAMNMWKKVMA